MNRSQLALLAALCTAPLALCPSAAVGQSIVTSRGDSLTRESTSFTLVGGTRSGELSSLRVPTARGLRASPRIALRFIRFRSTARTPAAPIVFLAGGPGDAATRAFSTMPVAILDSLLGVADVIAFDQRGTGRSEPNMACGPDGALPLDAAPTGKMRDSVARAAAARCLASVAARGIALEGFTTAESVEDIESMRIALGVPSVSLLGGSYGTHLGIAYLRKYGTKSTRAVLAGVEGPDDTFKRPKGPDGVFAEVARLAGKDSAFRARAPLLTVFDKLRAQLNKTPIKLTQGSTTVVITAWDLQRLVADALGDMRSVSALPAAIYAIDSGNVAPFARAAMQYRQARPINAMNVLMNCASGASPARRRTIASELPGSRLGTVIDFPATAVCELPNLPRLPDAFRAHASSVSPVLFISGTLDGRTPPSNVESILRDFPNGRHLVVEYQSHSLLGDRDVLSNTLLFLRGVDVPSARITRPPPIFKH
ncbi:MAG: alpha/beta fold hydrolase [Gemmatimonadaceae bacterium]|nr:alpha/beta fold hydrolase [Gemmatimonadaceae bacterium]